MKENTRPQLPARPPQSEEEAPWRQYPHIDAALEAENPPVLASLEKTCVELRRLIQSGTESDRERARTALAGCERALDLYHHLLNLRNERMRVDSNTGMQTPDNRVGDGKWQSKQRARTKKPS